MQSPLYKKAKLVKNSFLQKLLKQNPEENAVIEVNNLLAANPIKKVSRKDITDIEERYQLNLQKEFGLNLQEFYAVYLNYCLLDKSLSPEELEDLQHLKLILDINDNTIEKIHNSVGTIVYKKSFEEAISDGRLTDKEKSFLEELERSVKLSDIIVKRISEESRKAFMADHIKKIVSDQSLSPAEEKEMKAIAKSLNVAIELDDKSRAHLERLKKYWALENLELPVLKVDIKLQKDEVCHYKDYIEWLEERRNDWTVIDRGYVYLTNKRVVFTGIDKVKNIRLDKILTCTIQMQGVKLGKDTGKSPILKPKNDVDVMQKILGRLWKDF